MATINGLTYSQALATQIAQESGVPGLTGKDLAATAVNFDGYGKPGSRADKRLDAYELGQAAREIWLRRNGTSAGNNSAKTQTYSYKGKTISIFTNRDGDQSASVDGKGLVQRWSDAKVGFVARD